MKLFIKIKYLLIMLIYYCSNKILKKRKIIYLRKKILFLMRKFFFIFIFEMLLWIM